MRDYILFYVNNERFEVSGSQGFQSLSDFLRNGLNLVGTKVVCAEGDCGSCTVMIGKMDGAELRYQSYNSCIQYLYQLDCSHIITVEGLSSGEELHPVQQVMVDSFGSQCGYCTPGFVMSMASMMEENKTLRRNEVQQGLTGNLCRCTGYEQIIDAALSLNDVEEAQLSKHSIAEKFDLKRILADFSSHVNQSVKSECSEKMNGESRSFQFHVPATLQEALEIKQAEPNVKVVAGGTDVSVQINKEMLEPQNIMSLSLLSELKKLYIENQRMVVGAQVNLSDLEQFCLEKMPQFSEIISIFASPQIKHAGTLAGNIVNASPIADSLPFLHVMDAELELSGTKGSRWVNINKFYQSYKKTVMAPDELMTRICWSLLDSEKEVLKVYKVSKRKDLDISTFTAGIYLKKKDKKVVNTRLAFGGVGPIVIRLQKTEQFLKGKEISEKSFADAGKMALEEISPISDVRASSDYRLQLAENILLKFYHECCTFA